MGLRTNVCVTHLISVCAELSGFRATDFARAGLNLRMRGAVTRILRVKPPITT